MTCTSAICGRAHMWQPRGNNCTSTNRICASLQIPDVHVCMSASRRCARHDSRDLPGHRTRLKLRAHCGFADVHRPDLLFEDVHTCDLRTCKCFHVANTLLPRGNICTSAKPRCARNDSCDLPGHRSVCVCVTCMFYD